MTIQEVLALDFSGQNVVIIGGPASGKSYLCELLALRHPDHQVIHTDDYMEHGFEQSLYVLIEDLKKNISNEDVPFIIEGILGYRLLRKGVELDWFFPDVVIELEITDERLDQTYNELRDPAKLKGARSQAKACQTILQKYRDMPIEEAMKPEWISIFNNY